MVLTALNNNTWVWGWSLKLPWLFMARSSSQLEGDFRWTLIGSQMQSNTFPSFVYVSRDCFQVPWSLVWRSVSDNFINIKTDFVFTWTNYNTWNVCQCITDRYGVQYKSDNDNDNVQPVWFFYVSKMFETCIIWWWSMFWGFYQNQGVSVLLVGVDFTNCLFCI